MAERKAKAEKVMKEKAPKVKKEKAPKAPKPKKEKKGKKSDFASDSSLTAEDGFGSQPAAKKSKSKGSQGLLKT